MNLVVESGVGDAAANSWISLENADAYHAAIGNKEWAKAPDDDRAAFLFRAVVLFIIPRYAGRWKGEIHRSSQSLPWPRSLYVDEEGRYIRGPYIPPEVPALQCEVALSFITNPTQDDPREPGVILHSEKIGPLVETTQYNGTVNHTPTNPRVARLVRSLLEMGPGQVRIDRS